MIVLKRLIKSLLKAINLYYLKPYNVPRNTLLGIQKLPIKTVIDIGANTGQFARSIVNCFPDAKLFCFEPLPDVFLHLEQWQKETANEVVLFNVALGDTEGSVTMNLHTEHTASSSLLQTTAQNDELFPQTAKKKKINVKVTTLDKALLNYASQLSEEIMIKMDVQGFESNVIEGGNETIRLARAVILEVCIEKLYESQSDLKLILSQMNALGFYYAGNLEQYYCESDGRTLFFDAVFFRNNNDK
jgi:FkbM family methyltransferase